jgi:hypothetical protein
VIARSLERRHPAMWIAKTIQETPITLKVVIPPKAGIHDDDIGGVQFIE